MKKFIIPVVLLIFSMFFVFAETDSVFAHGNNYLEFNPDYFTTNSLNVLTSGSLYQVFLPSNEFMGGIDFWFDNAGDSGDVTFELFDGNNNLLRSKTTTIPHIDPNEGGQRVHVDWNSMLSVNGGNKYRVKISSALPGLRIYYSNRINFLGHNEPYMSDYVNGVAEVGGEEKEFSFKYALYETSEAALPVLSNISWSVVSDTWMKVEFNSNEPVDTMLEYGLTGQSYSQTVPFAGEYNFCAAGISSCSLIIPISADASYNYTLTVRDYWNNQNQHSGAFVSGLVQSSEPTPSVSSELIPTASATPLVSVTPTSSPPADNQPPAITGLKIASVTGASVKIAWTTNEAANSHLLISAPFLVTIIDDSDPTLELEHLLEVEGLNSQSNYIATVTSMDISGNQSRASMSFSTLDYSYPDVSPPTLNQTATPQPGQSNSSSQGNVVVSNGSGIESAFVKWYPLLQEEPNGGYRIDVFDEEGNFVKTVTVPSGTYSSEISDLKDGDYSVIVYANNDEVFEKIDQPTELRVGEPPFTDRLLEYWWALVPLLAGVGYLLWKNFRKKSQVVPVAPTN